MYERAGPSEIASADGAGEAADAPRSASQELGDSLRTLNDPGEIMRETCSSLSSTLGLASIHFTVIDPDGETARLAAVFENGRVRETPVGVRIRFSELDTRVTTALRYGRDIVVDDTRRTPYQLLAGGLHHMNDLLSGIIVPLVEDTGLVAWVTAGYLEAHNWSEEEIRTVRETAQRAWDSVVRARAQSALNESEARISAIATVVPDLLWQSDADGAVTWYNDHWYSYTGQTRGEAIGFGWIAAVHRGDREASRKAWLTALQRQEPLLHEHRIRRVDGEYRWFRARSAPIRDPNGVVTHWFGALTDIHERRLALGDFERRVYDRTEALVTANAALRHGAAIDAFRLVLADTLRHIEDPIEIQNAAARVLGRHLRASRVLYAEVDDRGMATVHRSYCDGVAELSGTYRLADFGTQNELSSGATVVISSMDADARLNPQARAAHIALGIVAEVVVPNVRGSRLNALLAVHHPTSRTWTANEIFLVEEAAARTWDAVERARAESERNLLRRQLANAEENERRRLSQELHDQLGQQLTAFALGIDDAARLAARADAESTEMLRQRLLRLQSLAHEMTLGARYVALELRPPELDDLGLESALETYVREWGLRYGIAAEFASTGSPSYSIVPETAAGLYRIAQEALTNVAKHARASRVSVVLERSATETRVIIEDDGAGFDVETATRRATNERRLGLAGMQERAALIGGTVTIESSVGEGTAVFVMLPGG